MSEKVSIVVVPREYKPVTIAFAPRRIAAIGPGTAVELRSHGLDPALVARESTQEGLLAELPRPPGRVLVAAAEGARRVIVDALDADFVALYRTVELTPAEPPCTPSLSAWATRRSAPSRAG